MSKQTLFLAGAALLLAGAAQADALEMQAAKDPPAVTRSEAPAPAPGAAVISEVRTAATAIQAERFPEANHPYLNGGHFGGRYSRDQ